MARVIPYSSHQGNAGPHRKRLVGILSVAIVFLALAAFGPNGVLGVSAVVVLLTSFALLWRSGESPVLLYLSAYQWLQVSTGIFYANWLGLSIDEYSQFGGDMTAAAALSLAGLLLLTAGMRLGAGAVRPRDGELARIVAGRHPAESWLWLYIVSWFVAALSQSLAWSIPALLQPLLALSHLKWAFFFMLTFATFSSDQDDGRRIYWLMVFCLELILSFGGYFSDFKTVFFFSSFGLLAARVTFPPRAYISFAAFVALLVTISIVWSAVKADYRAFVTGGRTAQVVSVDFGDQMGKLSELVSNIDGDGISRGLDSLIRRVGYLDFFALVINNVPSTVPHEGGAIWWDAIVRPFTPRLFFPEKADIDDSVRTRKYTGFQVAGRESATSISIGYMGEAYIDFGAFGMMPVLAGFGFFLGRVYRYFLRSPSSRGLLGMGLASVIIQGGAAFETSITKNFGGTIVMLLVSLLLTRLFIPRFAPWVRI